MFNKNYLSSKVTLLFLAALLTACGEEAAQTSTPKVEKTASVETAVKTEAAKAKENTTEISKATKTEATEETAETTEVSEKTEDKNDEKISKKNIDKNGVETITWDELIPASYDPGKIIDKYSEELAELQDDDPKAMELYGKIQAELDNAPVNTSLDGKTIKMPGFIAPLENNNGIISQFLLVPYFGACIHVPAPPINQTVMIKAKDGEGIKSEESSLPIWITGQLKAVEERTSIGAAGYRIENAQIEPYTEE